MPPLGPSNDIAILYGRKTNMHFDRAWFLTWHTYGTWLPGNAQGFVSPIRNDSGDSELHNIPQTTVESDHPRLTSWARKRLKCKPILFTKAHAEILAPQFQETAGHREWKLLTFAIVPNHVHIVVGVVGDPSPDDILGDFKSYGSRALNAKFPRPESGTWWTVSGSKRILDSDQSIFGAIRYTFEQAGALVVWCADVPELNLVGGYRRK
jgi:REP element-mobilizing transposase RayT